MFRLLFLLVVVDTGHNVLPSILVVHIDIVSDE
jgi:hypothetical protein